MEFCKLDIRKAIIKAAIKPHTDGRYTYNVTDDAIVEIINTTKTKNKTVARRIANSLATKINNDVKINSNIRARVEEKDNYSPITVSFLVDPAYIDSEFNKLPKDKQNNTPVDLSNEEQEFTNNYRDINYFNGDQALYEQETINEISNGLFSETNTGTDNSSEKNNKTIPATYSRESSNSIKFEGDKSSNVKRLWMDGNGVQSNSEISGKTFSEIFSGNFTQDQSLLYIINRLQYELDQNNSLRRIRELLLKKNPNFTINIVENPNQTLFENNGNIYISLTNTLLNQLKSRFDNGVNIDEFIKYALFEELTHAVISNVKDPLTGFNFSNGLDDKLADKIYNIYKNQLTTPYSYLQEGVRMKVQKDLLGVLTEEISDKSLLQKVLDWFREAFNLSSYPIFNDISNKTTEFIKNGQSSEQVKNDFNSYSTPITSQQSKSIAPEYKEFSNEDIINNNNYSNNLYNLTDIQEVEKYNNSLDPFTNVKEEDINKCK